MRRLFRRKSKGVPFEGPLTDEALRRWLVERLAVQVQEPPSAIDTARSFESYGLDSMVAVQVSGELEKIVERRLSPGLLYEHSSIDELSAYLGRELGLVDPV